MVGPGNAKLPPLFLGEGFQLLPYHKHRIPEQQLAALPEAPEQWVIGQVYNLATAEALGAKYKRVLQLLFGSLTYIAGHMVVFFQHAHVPAVLHKLERVGRADEGKITVAVTESQRMGFV